MPFVLLASGVALLISRAIRANLVAPPQPEPEPVVDLASVPRVFDGHR